MAPTSNEHRPSALPAAPLVDAPGLHGRGRFAPHVLGTVMLVMAGVTAVFALYAALAREPVAGFAAFVAVAGTAGFVLRRVGLAEAEPGRREALASVLLTWLVTPLLGAVPYVVELGMPFHQAVFESVSGFTSTGATVLAAFEGLPRSLLLWRAVTQWMGGIGIIVLFVAVFPQLAIAGRQMFFAELPGVTDERVTPRLRSTAAAVMSVYTGLTVLCAAAFALQGMPVAEALGHALTTVSAGGFTMHGDGLGHYQDPGVEWTAVAFMLVAGVSIPLLWRAVQGRPGLLLRDAEVRVYLAVAATASLALALLLQREGAAPGLRHAVFHAVSVMTTTGYATSDYAAWSEPAQAVLITLMLVGGSAGSASGGVKVLRWLIIAKNTFREVRRVLHPRAVLPVRVGNAVLAEEVLRAVAAFITLYVGLVVVCTVALVMLGSPFVEALTSALACVGNVGPGLGTVGPFGSYGDLHPAAHYVLSFGMFAGRLEVVTVFVVFAPSFWRLPRKSPLAWWRSGRRS
jgi:trk system potassium uptake protein TrkH